MSIYDKCTVKRQKYFYKVYKTRLYTIEDIFNSWSLDDQYLTNTLLRVRVKITNLHSLTHQVRTTIYDNIPTSFIQTVDLNSWGDCGWGHGRRKNRAKVNGAKNISVGRFLKFYGLSLKAIVSSLKAYIFCMWEEKIGNDVKSLQLWSLTDMIEIISAAPKGFLQWETKIKALYIASRFENKDIVRFIEQFFDYKNFSKTRIYARLRKVFDYSAYHFFYTSDTNISCDYLC